MNPKDYVVEYVSVVNTNYKVKNWLIYFLTLGRKGGYEPDKVPTLEAFMELKQEVEKLKQK